MFSDESLDRITDWGKTHRKLSLRDLQQFIRGAGLSGNQISGLIRSLYERWELYEEEFKTLDKFKDEIDKTLDYEWKRLSNKQIKEIENVEKKVERKIKKEEKEKEKDRVKEIKEIGNHRISKPEDIKQEDWNKNFTKIKHRNLNITPHTLFIIKEQQSRGLSNTEISRNLAIIELGEKNVNPLTPFGKRKVEARARSYRELLKTVKKEGL